MTTDEAYARAQAIQKKRDDKGWDSLTTDERVILILANR